MVLSRSMPGFSATRADTVFLRCDDQMRTFAAAISVSIAAFAAARSVSAVSVTFAAVVYPEEGVAVSCGGIPDMALR